MKRLLALPTLIAALAIASFASVTVTAPTSGATVQSPVTFVASAEARHGITGIAIYVDSKKVYSTTAASLNTSIAMTSGSHAVVVKASSEEGRVYSDSMTLVVKAATTPAPTPTPTPTPTPVTVPAPKVTTTSLASGTVGSAYSATLAASGGTSPYKWSVASGSVPAGLALSSSGTISGTPTASGASSFSVSVKDSETTPQSATATLTLTVAASASTLSISTASLSGATVGAAYSKTMSAAGGTSPYTWSLASGALPTGLTLSSAGVISGTPAASGSFSFTIEATDSEASPKSATAIESLAVSAAVSTSSTAPAPAQSAGFNTLAFNSTFSTLSLSDTGTGAGYQWYNPGIWYESPAKGASTPTNTGGVLNLPWTPGQSGTTSVGTMASNGANNTSWTHGYVEISMAFPPVTGIWPALWLQNNTCVTAYTSAPTSTIACGELDMFEWQSGTPSLFFGHIHDWTGATGSVSDQQNNDNNATATIPSGTNLADYNTYGVLITPTQISWYLNNQLLLTATSSEYPAAFATFNASPLYLMLTNQPGTNWGGSGSVNPSSATDMQVAWVHVWQ